MQQSLQFITWRLFTTQRVSGVRTPETCWAVNKRQVINWRDCCIWLVNLFEELVRSASTIFLISFQVFHTNSLQMGTHTEALKFDISEKRVHIHTIKTKDRNTCRYLSNQNVDAYRLHTTAALAYSRHNYMKLSCLSSRTIMMEEKSHKWSLYFCVRLYLQQPDGGPKRKWRCSKTVLNTQWS